MTEAESALAQSRHTGLRLLYERLSPRVAAEALARMNVLELDLRARALYSSG